MKPLKFFTDKVSGFTLLEVLVVLAIIAVIAGFSAPVYQSFQIRNDVDLAANDTTQSLRRAQALAQAVEGDMTWGVYIAPGEVVIFQGTDYPSRDVQYDEVLPINPQVAHTGISEIVFSKVDGIPSDTGTITFSGGARSVTLAVNSFGIIDF